MPQDEFGNERPITPEEIEATFPTPDDYIEFLMGKINRMLESRNSDFYADGFVDVPDPTNSHYKADPKVAELWVLHHAEVIAVFNQPPPYWDNTVIQQSSNPPIYRFVL